MEMASTLGERQVRRPWTGGRDEADFSLLQLVLDSYLASIAKRCRLKHITHSHGNPGQNEPADAASRLYPHVCHGGTKAPVLSCWCER